MLVHKERDTYLAIIIPWHARAGREDTTYRRPTHMRDNDYTWLDLDYNSLTIKSRSPVQPAGDCTR